jgi:hypothetical protein
MLPNRLGAPMLAHQIWKEYPLFTHKREEILHGLGCFAKVCFGR